MKAGRVASVFQAAYAVHQALPPPAPEPFGDGFGDDNPIQPIDRFTIGHAAWGTMLGLAAVPWWLTLGQAILWEVVENNIKHRLPQIFPDPRPDTLANSFFDIAACMVGWAAMRALPTGPEPSIWRKS